MSDPESPRVRVREPFAFENRTAATIIVFQNDGDFSFATIRSGETSSAMMIKAPMRYAYYTTTNDARSTTTQDARSDGGGPCTLMFLEVVARRP